MKKQKTMNRILACIAVFLLIFTAVMIFTFLQTGAVPDTLITCVFAACTGECGAMAWIRTTKDKLQNEEDTCGS